MRAPEAHPLRTLLLAAALLAAGAAPFVATLSATAEDTTVVYYLHSTGSANAQATGAFAVDTALSLGEPTVSASVSGVAPGMDAIEPSNAVASVAVVDGAGNNAYRKNGLIVYWVGEVSGRVSDASLALYLDAPTETKLVATLFGDAGSPFGVATATVGPSTQNPVVLAFAGAANVHGELVVQLGLANAEGAPALALYDGVDAPSALTFVVSPFVEDPPGEEEIIVPAPGWGAPVLINATASHRETSLALDPTDPAHMFVCAPSGVPNTQDGQSFFHASTDGGATWAYQIVETDASDPRKRAFEGGDCDVAFDSAGTMYSADTWLGSLSVGHSKDDGATWFGTSLAATAPVVDRPWLLTAGPGVVHVTWQDVQFGMPSAIWYARSTDYGLTFTPAVSVTTANQFGGFTWTGNFVMTPDQQQIFSVYTRRQGPAAGDLEDQGSETVWVARSTNGGLTWTQQLVATMPNPASFLYPSIGIDEANGLHVVFASRTDVDHPIWYAYSDDLAETWTAPVPVLSGVAGWSPWVVGAGPGEAAIAWYGTLDPLGNTTADFDWYFFTARVADGVFTDAGPTTVTPMFHGKSGIPEFNQLRLDADGKIHVGASAYHRTGDSTWWALWYQREV